MTDPINRIGETIAEADARYALTDAMSVAYREEFGRWRTISRHGTIFYDVARIADDGSYEDKATDCPTSDGELLFFQYRERAAMGAVLALLETRT